MNIVQRCAAVGICSIILSLGIYEPAAAKIPTQETTQKENDIVQYAKQFIGNPYVYGGDSLTDGIDCSHFVWRVLLNTQHYDEQYTVSNDWANKGQEVDSLDDAIAGDIIVYSGHVAIYDGDGKIIEAKGSKYGITYDRNVKCKEIIAIRRFN